MKSFPILFIAFLFLSCATLPVIQPPVDPSMTCPAPFPTKKTRLIHLIEARAAGETKAVLIGVTLADPVSRMLSCAILTPEGATLLEASFGPSGATVSRALPPFDSPDFARNMMEDMSLIFFAPPGAPVQKGHLAEGETVCRYREPDGWGDVIQTRDGRFYILCYTENGRLKRRVTLAGGRANPYSAVELAASERIDYALTMTLIESEDVKDETQSKPQLPEPCP